MTEGYADFDGFRTWYRIDGDLRPGDPDVPAPLVVLHGGPGATHEYLLALTDLAHDGRAVVFYDQLGNGNSTHLPERGADFWTVDLFVRELTNLVEHLGIGERFHVLGQSWGGFLAQEYAFTKPAGLRSLVISNSAASFPDFVAVANELRKELPPGSTTRCAGTRRRGRPTTRSTSPRATSSIDATCSGSTPGRMPSSTASRRSRQTRPSITR